MRSGRSSAQQVLAQGVGAAPRKAFGAGNYATDLRVWDAKLPMHLPLPRAVGPYTVIRTTRRVQLGTKVAIFGCFKYPPGSTLAAGVDSPAGQWTDICVVTDVNAGLNINDNQNVRAFTSPMSGLGAAATVCPSAFSVQVMNPEALQTTNGIVYMGTMNTQAKIADRFESWDGYGDKFIQFQNPRLMSAGKLALRGVQIDSYPLNMGDISDFTPLHQASVNDAFNFTSDQAAPSGWAPIVVVNANQPSGPDLEFLVTTEWRVRFDLDNPASAGHSHHRVASDSLWDSLTRSACARGHNVRDIADIISDAGSLASSAMSTAGVLRRALTTFEVVD